MSYRKLIYCPISAAIFFNISIKCSDQKKRWKERKKESEKKRKKELALNESSGINVSVRWQHKSSFSLSLPFVEWSRLLPLPLSFSRSVSVFARRHFILRQLSRRSSALLSAVSSALIWSYRPIKRQEQVFRLSLLRVLPTRTRPQTNLSPISQRLPTDSISLADAFLNYLFILLTRECQHCCQRCFDNIEHRRSIR